MKSAILILIPLILALTPGCTTQRCGCIASVFAGFNLIAEYPMGTKILDLKPKGIRAFPKEFLPGRIYIFQPTERVETEKVAIETFPKRLRKCSAKILEAPRNSGDFGVASLGGPFWWIRFRMGRCVGRLTNRYDRELASTRKGWPSGSRDDYILELSESK